MRIELEVSQRQAAAVLFLAAVAFIAGTMYGSGLQKKQMQEAGWIGPDDWACLNFKGGPDSNGIVRLFNDSMSFEQCGLSDDHRVIANSVYERPAAGDDG